MSSKKFRINKDCCITVPKTMIQQPSLRLNIHHRAQVWVNGKFLQHFFRSNFRGIHGHLQDSHTHILHSLPLMHTHRHSGDTHIHYPHLLS